MLKLETVDLKQSVNRLEDGIIVLSGPALAISGIIAGIDLVTGGNMLRSLPVLTLIWAICLLLTLDFQVLNLGVRARRLYVDEKKSTKRKAGEIAIAVVIAAAISYVSIQMQSIIAIANSASIPVAEAADRLGINLLALTWERSILVLALIFLSGWSRETKSDSSVPSAQEVKQEQLSDENMALILQQLAELQELKARLAQPQITVSVSPETPVALIETGETESETEAPEPALDEQLKALLAVNGNVTSREAAIIVKRPHTTVFRALNRVKQMKQE